MARSTRMHTCHTSRITDLVAHAFAYVGNLRDEQWTALPSAKPEVAFS